MFKQQQVNFKMETALTFKSNNSKKSKSGLGKSSGIKRMNKKEASAWFQNLLPAEQSLLKQKSNSSSSSSLEERKTKKEMHERERELILKRRSEHEARMKAQLQSKSEITQQIQKCKDMRSQLIPHQMRLEQMKLHESHTSHFQYNLHFQYKLGMLGCGISNQLLLIKNEEKVLFDMQHKHHCIKKSVKNIIEKTKTSYTKVQAKNYLDNVYKKLVTV